ncbi:hypothetical protein [Plantactinospora sp. GCM10030261]|uniref:MGH1-like glycoside hydrolase domain-containing protein n=1 Tax=Plantactinospora sp. GCM10030261 TaxID=3273420 RepID=UPI00360EFC7C
MTAAFPVDDYTPHGYLDVPGHTRRLTPRGVLRSHDVGFRWHYPALGTGYGGRRETYRAGLRIAVDGALALADFTGTRSPYHSKNLMEVVARHPAGTVTARFHLVGEDVLAARVTGRAGWRLTVRADYRRQVSADLGWGESGLVGRRTGTGLVLQGFEDGEVFVLWTAPAAAGGPEPVAAVTGSAADAADWVTGGVPADTDDRVTVLGGTGQTVELSGLVEYPAGDHDLTVLLARGRTEREARDRLDRARADLPVAYAAHVADDDRFWTTAPRLGGDWPDHWRRGLVYDLETLRMMVKRPVGVYTRQWDAMQVQAPRVVLGEAAIDALLLGWADPATAQRMLLGTFVDALAPNVPCSREDGTLNMVSADGSACGTGPQWGYPWLVVQRLYDRRPDRDWLDALYPHLSAYLDWWAAHRTDADGWLVHACSWESGQDLSPRFGDQPLGGGHPTHHLRPVDLHAAVAHAAATMAGFAGLLGRERDVPGWRALAAEHADRVALLWTGRRYADMDARTGAGTEVDDVMLWAPLTLGLAGAEQADAVRPAVRAVDPDTLVWPMFAWTAIDAAGAVGEWDTAAATAGAIVDRAYRFWDARTHDEGRTLPGIACEYWPLSGRCGGEGYGWGAFGVHLVLGVLAGIRVTGDRLAVRPNLPADLRVPGRRYDVRLTCSGRPVPVSLRPTDDGVHVEVDGRGTDLAWGEEATWPLT